MTTRRSLARLTFLALCLPPLAWALPVSGRVVSAAGGEAVPGALVGCGGLLSMALEDGSFSLECGEGLVELRVEAPGYLPALVQVLAGSTGLLVPLAPFETAGGEILVTASREPVTQALPAYMDAAALEAAPSGGNPVYAALAEPSLTDFRTMSSDTGLDSQDGTMVSRPAFAFNGSDPAWTRYAIDFIELPRTQHYSGFPVADGVLPERTLAGVEIYAGQSPAFLGPGSSGLVRFMTVQPRETSGSAHVGIGNLGGALSLGDGSAGLLVAVKKSTSELTIDPLMSAGRSSLYASSDYVRGGGTGSAIARADLSWTDASLQALLLGFYDSWYDGDRSRLDGSMLGESATAVFAGLGLRGERGFGEASLGGFVYGTYSGEDARSVVQSGGADVGSMVRRGLDGRASIYATAPLGALELSAGLSASYAYAASTLVNAPRWVLTDLAIGGPQWEYVFPDSPFIPLHEGLGTAPYEEGEMADPEPVVDDVSSAIATVYPWLAGSAALGEGLDLSFSLAALWHPDRGLLSPLGSLSLRGGTAGAASWGTTVGAQAISPIPSEANRLAILALTEALASDAEEGFQRSLSATLRTDIPAFGLDGFAEGRGVYYYELSGVNAQTSGAWTELGGEASDVDMELLEPERAYAAAGDLGARWEGGPFSAKASYTLSTVAYEVPGLGWVRANSDIRHVARLSLSLSPETGFAVAVNLGLNAGRPFTPLSVVADASSPEGARIARGAFNSAADDLPRYSLDLKLAWRFPAFGGIGEIYIDTVNLVAFLNPTYGGLKPDLLGIVGSDTARFEDRHYSYANITKMSLLGTVLGFRVRW